MFKNKLGKRIFAVILSVMMTSSLVANNSDLGNVQAAKTIGKIVHTGVLTTYTSFDDLVDDLDDFDNETVIIDMLTDWNAAGDSDFDRRMIIPSKCRATLNMHGHVFNRNRAWDKDWCRNGELICVESNATLTINGASNDQEKNVEHKYIPVHTSTSRSGTANKNLTMYGGLLMGGSSTNGAGGIHMKSNSTVTLNDTTLAGCRAEQRAGTDGYGGGVWMTGGGANFRMNNSTITGCYAYNDGGGIYASNEDNITIEMNNSHIDSNYAYDEGGGINLDGENVFIFGDRNSTVSNNQCGTHGGAIYAWNDDQTYSGLIIEGNQAKEGGGIYTKEQTTTLSDLVVRKNTSTERGGGIYINNDENTISNCEITGNRAKMSGGGVYVNSDVDVDFKVIGETVIKGNSADVGFGQNLYISDNDPEDSRVMFNLYGKSDVHMSYYDTKNKDTIMVTMGKAGDQKKSPNCTRFLTSDNSGYYFAFQEAPSQRKIVMKKGTKPVQPTPVKVSVSDAGPVKTGTVGAGGGEGTDYDLIRGYYIHQKTDSVRGDEDKSCVFYYSDALFYGEDSNPQYKYNSHLATASINMAFAACYSQRNVDADANDNTYYNKHANGRQFLADIGCPDENIYVNNSMVSKPGTDSIGIIIGSKELAKADGTKTGDILIPVAFRGAGYESEWCSNVTLGTAAEMTEKGCEAKGFASAADQAVTEIFNYLDKYNLRDAYKSGHVKFWVAGYSRAGATTNLTCKRLVDRIEEDCDADAKSQVFGYPCEAPKGGTDIAEVEGNNYECIHNLINTADVVPLTAPEEMGFKRYGVDHYIPGNEAGEVTVKTKNVSCGGNGGPKKVTVKYDNTAMRTKGGKEGDAESKAYIAKRNEMVKQLGMIDSNIVFDDYFHPMSMSFFASPHMFEVGSYDNSRVEDFLVDFMYFFQNGDGEHDWSKVVSSRDKWANEKYKYKDNTYTTIQTSMQDLMRIMFGLPTEKSGGFVNRIQTITGRITTFSLIDDITMASIYFQCIGCWYEDYYGMQGLVPTKLWDKAKETGALDELSKDEQNRLEKDWPTIVNMIFMFIDGDYNYKPGKHDKAWAGGSTEIMMYLPTFATFSSYILTNHYPEINVAWARTYDSWYDGETSEYEIDESGYSIGKPAAMVKFGDETKTLDEGKDNLLSGDNKILLDVEGTNGEAIYYDLKNNTTGKQLASNQIYRGGVDLFLNKEKSASFTLTTYAMSFGVKSEKAVYNIELITDKHDLIVDTGEQEPKTYQYKEKEHVSVTANTYDDKFFAYWSAELLDDKGDPVSEDIAKILLEDKGSTRAVFNMPEAGKTYGDVTCPVDYKLKLTANYKDKIKKVTVAPDVETGSIQPVAGEELAELAKISFDNGADDVTCLISWTYTYDHTVGEGDEAVTESRTVPASGEAYNNTVYTATIKVPQNQAEYILFNSNLSAEASEGTVISVTKNEIDGSAVIVIEYDETGTGGKESPYTTIKLTVCPFEINLCQYLDWAFVDYYALQDTVITLTAPELKDDGFLLWRFGDSGIQLLDGYTVIDKTIKVRIPDGLTTDELAIEACYAPVINNITAYVEMPEGGEPIGDASDIYITIDNTYRVNEENYKISWSPDMIDYPDGTKRAEYLVEYNVNISVIPNEDGKVKVTPVDPDTKLPTGEEITVEGSFFFDENLHASINDVEATTDMVTCSINATMPMTKYVLVAIKNPDDISGVKNGTDEDGIRELLPDTVRIILDNMSEMDADITWNLEKGEQASPLDKVTWTATGTVTLPDTVENKYKWPLDDVVCKIYVDEAEHASSPSASIVSGSYLPDKVINLITSEDGGTTYYTTDGSDPTESGRVYEGEDILFCRADIEPDEEGIKRLILKAYTHKDGMFDSSVVTYNYEFSNNIPVPKNAKEFTYNTTEQLLLPSNEFYNVKSTSLGRVDEKGNLWGTDAGTYKVTLSLADENYKWLILKGNVSGEELGETTSSEDYDVTYTIKPLSMNDVSVAGITNKVYTGKALTQNPVVTLTLDGEEFKLTEGKDYKVTYKDNVNVGKATVIITGMGNFNGNISQNFEITKTEDKKTEEYKKAVAAAKKIRCKITSAKAKKGKKALVKWKKYKSVSGYQIRYSTDKKFKKKVKKVKINKAKTRKRTLKKLKAGKRYYVQVRTFTKIKNPTTGKTETVYGKWSKTKKFKAKK